MKSNGDAAKDPRQIAHEVDEQRREISDTIHALGEKFSSHELYNQTAAYVRDHGREFAESLGNSLKANPLPIMLTSIGILWMMMGQRQPTTYRPEDRETAGQEAGDLHGTAAAGAERIKEKAGTAREKVAASTQRLKGSATQMRESLSRSMGSARGSMGNARGSLQKARQSARGNFEHYMHEQPLAMGAIGIALGALMGASLPRTQTENKAVGDISERVRRKTSETETDYEPAGTMGESIRGEGSETRHSEYQSPPATSAPQGPKT
jgi:ElaB/YqjD/DUF883 family membrane-anchored ribosome-binding protein